MEHHHPCPRPVHVCRCAYYALQIDSTGWKQNDWKPFKYAIDSPLIFFEFPIAARAVLSRCWRKLKNVKREIVKWNGNVIFHNPMIYASMQTRIRTYRSHMEGAADFHSMAFLRHAFLFAANREMKQKKEKSNVKHWMSSHMNLCGRECIFSWS